MHTHAHTRHWDNAHTHIAPAHSHTHIHTHYSVIYVHCIVSKTDMGSLTSSFVLRIWLRERLARLSCDSKSATRPRLVLSCCCKGTRIIGISVVSHEEMERRTGHATVKARWHDNHNQPRAGDSVATTGRGHCYSRLRGQNTSIAEHTHIRTYVPTYVAVTPNPPPLK